MKEDPPPDAKCRDKFLVQSVAIAPGTDTSFNVSQIWSNVESTAKSSIQEKKIRVSFLPAEGSSAGGLATTHEEDQPPAYSSPSPPAVTPRKSMGTDKEVGEGAAAGGVAGAVAGVASAAPSNQEELKQQLADAQNQIKRLQEQVTEGIRQRKPQETASKAAESVQQTLSNASQQAPGGVPVQIAALLCLVCFLLAYFFF